MPAAVSRTRPSQPVVEATTSALDPNDVALVREDIDGGKRPVSSAAALEFSTEGLAAPVSIQAAAIPATRTALRADRKCVRHGGLILFALALTAPVIVLALRPLYTHHSAVPPTTVVPDGAQLPSVPNSTYYGEPPLRYALPPANNPLTFLAHGSCADQHKPQAFWRTLLNLSPQLFLFNGDSALAPARAQQLYPTTAAPCARSSQHLLAPSLSVRRLARSRVRRLRRRQPGVIR